MNTDLIQEISQFEEQVMNYQDSYKHNMHVPFNFSQIDFEKDKSGEMYLNGIKFSNEAKTKLLGTFQMKGKFASEANKKVLGEDDINAILATIQNLNLGNRLFCQYDDISSPSEVKNIWLTKEPQDINNLPDYSIYFQLLKEKLEKSPFEFKKDVLSLDETNGRVEIDLIANRDFNVGFDNGTGLDIWHGGAMFTFDPYAVNASSYFSRQVCSNGMVMRDKMKRMNFDHSKFGQDKFERIVNRYLTNGEFLDVEQRIIDHCQRAQNTNASVLEYLDVIKLFNEEQLNNPDIRKRFNIDYLYGAYQLAVTEQSKKWQATADTNKPLYEVINDLTWVASRPKEYELTEQQSLDYKIAASQILLREEYHLESLAPNPFKK